jgi:hypothetical protein
MCRHRRYIHNNYSIVLHVNSFDQTKSGKKPFLVLIRNNNINQVNLLHLIRCTWSVGRVKLWRNFFTPSNLHFLKRKNSGHAHSRSQPRLNPEPNAFTIFHQLFGSRTPGLPDFSRYYIPKRGKIYLMTKKYQMPIKHTQW